MPYHFGQSQTWGSYLSRVFAFTWFSGPELSVCCCLSAVLREQQCPSAFCRRSSQSSLPPNTQTLSRPALQSSGWLTAWESTRQPQEKTVGGEVPRERGCPPLGCSLNFIAVLQFLLHLLFIISKLYWPSPCQPAHVNSSFRASFSSLCMGPVCQCTHSIQHVHHSPQSPRPLHQGSPE